MRRREEGLGFWLQHSPATHDRRVKFGASLGSWLKLPILAPDTIDLSAEVSIQAILCTAQFLHARSVIDGVGFPGQRGCASGTRTIRSCNSKNRGQREAIEQQDNEASKSKATMPEQQAVPEKESYGKGQAEEAGNIDDKQRAEPARGSSESQHAVAAATEKKAGLDAAARKVVSDHLPNITAVEFSWRNDAAIKSRDLMPAARVKSSTLWNAGREVRAHAATLLDLLPPPPDPPASFLPLNLPVHVGTPRLTRFPHSRKSVDLSTLSVQESERLVSEGETVRGIAHGQGELLALFLSVPVEIVSRVRFVDETKQLLYTLTPRSDLTRTRVHDMIAVRDRKSGETHLVPHRTRYRMAFLA